SGLDGAIDNATAPASAAVAMSTMPRSIRWRRLVPCACTSLPEPTKARVKVMRNAPGSKRIRIPVGYLRLHLGQYGSGTSGRLRARQQFTVLNDLRNCFRPR